MIGGLVLCSANAWAAENPAVGTTIAIPAAGRCVRAAAPAGARGRRTAWAGWPASPGWCCSGWAGTARWRRSVSATGGPTSAAGRSWSLRCSPRSWCTSPASATSPGRRGRLGPRAAGAAGQRAGHDRHDHAGPAQACATLLVLGLVTAFAPRAWAQGAAALTGLGVLVAGILLVAGPWPALLALRLRRVDGRGPGPGDAERHGLLDGRRGRAHRGRCRGEPAASCPRRRRAGTRPSWSARSRRQSLALGGLVLVLELEPPVVGGCPGRGSGDRDRRRCRLVVARRDSSPRSSAAAPRRTSPSSRCTPPRPTTC